MNPDPYVFGPPGSRSIFIRLDPGRDPYIIKKKILIVTSLGLFILEE